MEKILLALLLVCCVYRSDAHVFRSLKPLEASEEYTHTQIINEDNPEQYQLFWKLLKNDEIQFEVHCKTTGWVAVGISATGGMTGADIAIGWVKDGIAYLKDCHATGKTTPKIDEKQDYTLIEGEERNGYTILKFKRKLTTCDEQDKEIKIGTQFMIFAWNPVDPETGENDWQYHGSNRIQRTLMLLSYKDESLDQQFSLPADTFTHTLKVDNLKVPVKDTFYWCDLYKVPKFDRPAHMIQFEILLNKDTKQHFHHLLVYECEEDFIPDGPLAQECGVMRLPQKVEKNCLQKILIGWGVGGQLNYTFPKQAGFRFTPTDKDKYFMIEFHYDNPTLKPEMIDNSGVKMYFTEQLREHDLGVLLLGTDGNSLVLQIPPKTKDITFSGICYPECTQRYIPDEGIYAVSGLLHTHLAGRSVKTTLVRNDVAVQELFDNPNYDFNYQFIMDIEPVKLKKGDALITKCRYETMDRDNFTFGGFGTYDEMCYDFLYYYPAQTSFVGCMTVLNTKIVYDFYRSLMKDSLIPEIKLDEMSFGDVKEFFQTKVNSTSELIKRFEQFFGNPQNRTVYCGNPNGDLIHKENVLDYVPKANAIVEADQCKNNAGSSFSFNLLPFVMLLLNLLK